MSRTNKSKKAKGPGYEYWSKRPTPLTSPGKEAKKLTHRLERIQAKKQIKEELDEE